MLGGALRLYPWSSRARGLDFHVIDSLRPSVKTTRVCASTIAQLQLCERMRNSPWRQACKTYQVRQNGYLGPQGFRVDQSGLQRGIRSAIGHGMAMIQT